MRQADVDLLRPVLGEVETEGANAGARVEDDTGPVRRDLDTGRVAAGAPSLAPAWRASRGIPRSSRAPPYASQKMTMMPWNSSSGPNSGNAVVAMSRLTPSKPGDARLPCDGRRSVKAMPPGVSSRRTGSPSVVEGEHVREFLDGISPVSANDWPATLRRLVEVHEALVGVGDVDRRSEVRRELTRQDEHKALLPGLSDGLFHAPRETTARRGESTLSRRSEGQKIANAPNNSPPCLRAGSGHRDSCGRRRRHP